MPWTETLGGLAIVLAIVLMLLLALQERRRLVPEQAEARRGFPRP